jgi:hypothetical protein
MERRVVALHGDFEDEQVDWQRLGNTFDFRFESSDSQDSLRKLYEAHSLAGVLWDWNAETAPAPEDVELVQESAPGARIVLCHPIVRSYWIEDLETHGLFHALLRPLQMNEVRQALGFLWQALSRDEAAGRLRVIQGKKRPQTPAKRAVGAGATFFSAG